jgi:hypothetical protein
MTTSDYIATGALVASIASLLYTVKGVNAARRATQLQVFNSIFDAICALDRRYTVEFKSQNKQPTDEWCSEFFNTVEYLAFLLNHNLVLRRELFDFYKDAVRHWYATFASVQQTSVLDNPDYFPEFKRLHRKVKYDVRPPICSLTLLRQPPYVQFSR